MRKQIRTTYAVMALSILGCASRQGSKETKTDTTSNRIYTAQHQYMHIANDCKHTSLSNQFDIEVNINRYIDTVDYHDSSIVRLLILDKSTGSLLDSTSITSNFYFDFVFASCDGIRSYTTKINSDSDAVDNYFGDIVVADLNFDDRDDIALINNSGGNGGPLYSYFIQGDNRKFALDRFLTDSMSTFPHKIDKHKRRLTTYVHANVACVGEHIYQYNITTRQWRQISHKFLCDE